MNWIKKIICRIFGHNKKEFFDEEVCQRCGARWDNVIRADGCNVGGYCEWREDFK